MSLLVAARKSALLNSKIADKYHADQYRRSVLDAGNGVEINYTKDNTVAQPPMRAIVRVTGISPVSGPSVINRTYESVPEPRPVLDPTPGSPVDLTVGEIQRMSAEDRQRALARILAVDGARERMKPDGTRTLTQALEAELEYQRAMVRASKRAAQDGKSVRNSKTQSKIDRKAGRPKRPAPGTASFKMRTPIRVSIQIAGNYLSTGRSSIDPEYGYCIVEKRGRGQPDILAKNAKG